MGSLDGELLAMTDMSNTTYSLSVYYDELEHNQKRIYNLTHNFQEFKEPFDPENIQSIKKFLTEVKFIF